MLEKDIENLLASYPDEFFPNAGFKLMDQQVRLGKYYADIIFTDKHSRKIIVEVKRGTLSRDAVGQIIDYYGLIKEQEPKQCIELILCANTIPPERRKFLEITGIECKELDISLLEKIAKKYNYKFLDELKVETNKEINHKIEIGINRVIPDAENVIIPMADSDEGIVQALVDATDGEIITAEVSDPLGNRIKSELGKATVSQTTQNPQPVTVITPLSTTIPLKQKHPHLRYIVFYAYLALIMLILIPIINYSERTGDSRLSIFFLIFAMISLVIATIWVIWRNAQDKKFKE
jgi:glycerate kinase